jgi:hypothetical protein
MRMYVVLGVLYSLLFSVISLVLKACWVGLIPSFIYDCVAIWNYLRGMPGIGLDEVRVSCHYHHYSSIIGKHVPKAEYSYSTENA